jgi:iron-sulfur cluster assembly accessory protein
MVTVDKAIQEASDSSVESLIFKSDGIQVFSDVVTLEMINGSNIEYKEEMIRSSFEVVGNPQAESGCSCGTSFTPKNL